MNAPVCIRTLDVKWCLALWSPRLPCEADCSNGSVVLPFAIPINPRIVCRSVRQVLTLAPRAAWAIDSVFLPLFRVLHLAAVQSGPMLYCSWAIGRCCLVTGLRGSRFPDCFDVECCALAVETRSLASQIAFFEQWPCGACLFFVVTFY